MENIMNNSIFRKLKLERRRKFANAKFKVTEAFMYVYGGGAVRKAQTAFLNMARVKNFRENLPERSRKIFDGIFGTEKNVDNSDSKQRMGAAGALANMGIYLTTYAGVRSFGGAMATDFDALTGAVNMGMQDAAAGVGSIFAPEKAYADEIPSVGAEVTNESLSTETTSFTAENTSSYGITGNETVNSDDYSTVAEVGAATNDNVMSTDEDINIVAMSEDNNVLVDVNGDGNEDAVVKSDEPVIKEELTDGEKKQLENEMTNDNTQTTSAVDTPNYENADIAYTQEKSKDDLTKIYENLNDESKNNFGIESNTSINATADNNYVIPSEFDKQDKQIIIIDTDKGKVAIAMNEYFDGQKTPTTVNDNMLAVIINNLNEQNPGMFDGKDITIVRTDLCGDVCKVDLDGDGVYDIFISEKDGNTVVEGDCIKGVDNVIANNIAKENVPDTPDKDGKIPETTPPETAPTEPITTPTEPETTPTEPVTTPTESVITPTEPVSNFPQTGDNTLNAVVAAAATAVAAGTAAKIAHDKMKAATDTISPSENTNINHEKIVERAKYEVLMQELQAEFDNIYNSYFNTDTYSDVNYENNNSLSNSSGRTR